MIVGFTGSPLDRADAVRSDLAAYAALTSNWRARVMVLAGGIPRVADGGALAWGSIADAAPDAELVLLGVSGDTPYFAAVEAALPPVNMRAPAMWGVLAQLPAPEAAIFGTAISLIAWHNGHRFCARCGGTTTLARAGWGRTCNACAAEHFPRTDPVVIMLAEHDGPSGRRALVGRQTRFPPGNYSALAGFLEPGESIEEAVRREIMEESGVPCGDVRYVASQPWPFGGAQLMIACIAEALDDTITLDTNELEDAMWVTRDDVRAALAGEGTRFKAPPPFAIANTLLRAWVSGDAEPG